MCAWVSMFYLNFNANPRQNTSSTPFYQIKFAQSYSSGIRAKLFECISLFLWEIKNSTIFKLSNNNKYIYLLWMWISLYYFLFVCFVCECEYHHRFTYRIKWTKIKNKTITINSFEIEKRFELSFGFVDLVWSQCILNYV